MMTGELRYIHICFISMSVSCIINFFFHFARPTSGDLCSNNPNNWVNKTHKNVWIWSFLLILLLVFNDNFTIFVETYSILCDDG